MLKPNNTAFVLVDVQGRLATLMYDKQSLFSNLQKLIKSLQILGVPIIWLEQMPQAIGTTSTVLASLLPKQQPIVKSSFSAWANNEFVDAVMASGANSILVAGIEAHVCVYQTATDLFDNGFDVEVIADAVSSRSSANKNIALTKMQQYGLKLSSTEMALFELMGNAESKAFKQIIKIIK
ncbi:isochorismatase family protein [Thalassotalea sp. Y01]|uniref:isochorismatase family protein n=1 Tax=Thalassotalea sp. Y01 TaxID=2729613 RepID=UPI00145FBD76|nr:isochorismatase family protein [Thalassotalea sp. Y01]NMP16459.1 isochorismatase family protein [Thalassotalea sp. Y01]